MQVRYPFAEVPRFGSTIVAPVNASQFLFLSLSLVVSGVHALIVEEAATHSLMAIEV